MWYGYGGCTIKWEESRGSIGDELEVEYYGGDGQDRYKLGICLPFVMVLLLSNYRGILYLGQTPSTTIWPNQPGHITSGRLICLMSPCTVSFP
jgi:hypothetical protein